MTDKYISQLLGIAEQRERQIRMSWALAAIEEKAEDAPCPEEIREMLRQYRIKGQADTVKQAKKCLKDRIKYQEQRCHMIQREDLLPLIHYVAQHRYLREISGKMENYRRRDAVAVFQILADEIFDACQMARLDEAYRLDYLLLQCYGEEDIFSLSDLIELSRIME